MFYLRPIVVSLAAVLLMTWAAANHAIALPFRNLDFELAGSEFSSLPAWAVGAVAGSLAGRSTKAWKAYAESIPAEESKIIDKAGGYIAVEGGYPIVQAELVLAAGLACASGVGPPRKAGTVL